MTLTLAQLSLACPHQLWLEFCESEQKTAWPVNPRLLL